MIAALRAGADRLEAMQSKGVELDAGTGRHVLVLWPSDGAVTVAHEFGMVEVEECYRRREAA